MNPQKLWSIKKAAEEISSTAEALYETTGGGEIDTSERDDELIIMLIRNLNDKVS